ncbi:hypothetical protein HOU02_gp233 [Caulobacter phage CcrBL9]|uniref:Uncharacterized protein n=1 Tax=Caulobacter phage CcrBL9 TaxID=2283270 RepID=A0A385EF74_9CAUD|nr:hypothetical protein HOU02_gp233 [Caulobacter phage CcrBL9]AXQ69492.1 hypothetical protein CcrBL9_gp468 [Caulobacter phage CcrBL9]
MIPLPIVQDTHETKTYFVVHAQARSTKSGAVWPIYLAGDRALRGWAQYPYHMTGDQPFRFKAVEEAWAAAAKDTVGYKVEGVVVTEHIVETRTTHKTIDHRCT